MLVIVNGINSLTIIFSVSVLELGFVILIFNFIITYKIYII